MNGKFLIFALEIVIFAVTKWYRGRDKPLDPDLFDSPEKRERRRKFKEDFFDNDGLGGD